MIPAGRPLKTGIDVASTDINKLLVELRAREFSGYAAITVKGVQGIEEGIVLLEKGKIIGCSYEYMKHGKTVTGQKAFERVLNATAAKYGVMDLFELEPQQIDLTLAFNESLVFVPNTGELRQVKVQSFSPAYENEVIGSQTPASPESQEQPGQLAKKYKLSSLTKNQEKEQELPKHD